MWEKRVSMIAKALEKVTLLQIILFAAAVYLLTLTPRLSTSEDEALFILISRQFLREGVLKTITTSSIPCIANYSFLPLLLVPFSAIAPENFLLMKLILVASALLCVALLYELLEGLCEEPVRKAVTLLFAFNPLLVEHAGQILTDCLYTALLLATFLCFKRYIEKQKAWSFFLCLFFTMLCTITKAVGCLTLPALLLMLAIKRKGRAFLLTALVAGAVVSLFLPYWSEVLKKAVGEGIFIQNYYSEFQGRLSAFGIVGRAGRSMLVYAGNYLPDIFLKPLVSFIAPRLPGGGFNPLFVPKFLCGVTLFAFIIAGFQRSAKEKKQLFHVYCIFHMLVLLSIYAYVARYLLPLLPFLLFFIFKYFFEGSSFKKRLGITLAGALLTLSLFDAGRQIAFARSGFISPEIKSFVQCNDWIKAHAPAGSLILSRKAKYTRVYTGRPCTGYIFSKDDARQYDYIVKSKADYIIAGDLGFFVPVAGTLQRVAQKHPEEFIKVYQSDALPRNQVYQVIKDKMDGRIQ